MHYIILILLVNGFALIDLLFIFRFVCGHLENEIFIFGWILKTCYLVQYLMYQSLSILVSDKFQLLYHYLLTNLVGCQCSKYTSLLSSFCAVCTVKVGFKGSSVLSLSHLDLVPRPVVSSSFPDVFPLLSWILPPGIVFQYIIAFKLFMLVVYMYPTCVSSRSTDWRHVYFKAYKGWQCKVSWGKEL